MPSTEKSAVRGKLHEAGGKDQRMLLRMLACLICPALSAQSPGQANRAEREGQEKAAIDLRARIDASPRLPFNGRIGNPVCESSATTGVPVPGQLTKVAALYRESEKASPCRVLARQKGENAKQT